MEWRERQTDRQTDRETDTVNERQSKSGRKSTVCDVDRDSSL